jgi:hypothetical protein
VPHIAIGAAGDDLVIGLDLNPVLKEAADSSDRPGAQTNPRADPVTPAGVAGAGGSTTASRTNLSSAACQDLVRPLRVPAAQGRPSVTIERPRSQTTDSVRCRKRPTQPVRSIPYR